MRILIMNGPNINLLGLREPEIYGHITYNDLLDRIQNHANELQVKVAFYQSNHEGDLVDAIQEAKYPNAPGVRRVLPQAMDLVFANPTFDAIIINPAAYTHTSVALLDVLKAVQLPTVEIHISDPMEREDFRHLSYVGMYAEKTIRGHGLDGYLEALDYLVEKYRK